MTKNKNPRRYRIRRSQSAAACLAFALVLFAGCGDSVPVTVLPEPTTLPEALSDIDATFHEAIAYGPSDEKNLFDILLPTDSTEAPLVLYFHGGGFGSGSRSKVWGQNWSGRIKRLIDAGVAFASADYRFISKAAGIGVKRSLEDGALCLQFIRFHAKELGINPDRVVLVGGSAGAGMSLWIGTNNDMADLDNENPILRESTRVNGVVLLETQATYDVARWSTDVFPDLGIGVLEGAAVLGLEGRLLAFYGISDPDQFESPETQAYRRSIDMLALLSSDDPPIFVRNKNQPNQIPVTVALLYHHANHALVVANRARDVGVECIFYAPALGIEDPSGEGEVDFALRHLLA